MVNDSGLTLTSVCAHANLLDPTSPDRYGTAEIIKAIKLAHFLGIKHVHWKDMPGKWLPKHGKVFGCGMGLVPLGDGIVGIEAIVKELVAQGFDGHTPKSHTDFRELLADPGIDAVDIAIWGLDYDIQGPYKIKGTGTVATPDALFNTITSWDVQMEFTGGIQARFMSHDIAGTTQLENERPITR